MAIEIVKEPISRKKLAEIAANQFGNFVKAVVDVSRDIMAIGGELHADGEAALIELGSDQQNLWGINLYPEKTGGDFIEFDSMINIRPSQNNSSRGVEDIEIQKRVRKAVSKLVLD